MNSERDRLSPAEEARVEAVISASAAKDLLEDLADATIKAFPKDRIGDHAKRKSVPLFSGCFKYFPDALLAVAELSRIGNDQHNPGEPLHWAREKSGDELDAAARHMIDAGTFDIDGTRHSTKLVWRTLANLQKEIELDREKERK